MGDCPRGEAGPPAQGVTLRTHLQMGTLDATGPRCRKAGYEYGTRFTRFRGQIRSVADWYVRDAGCRPKLEA